MPVETAPAKLVYKRPESLADVPNHYCPGCGHGIIHKLLAQCIDELGIRESTILVAPVGCSVLAYNYLRVDGCEAAHGQGPRRCHRESSGSIRTGSSSPTRGTATFLPSARRRRSTPPTAGRRSPSSS